LQRAGRLHRHERGERGPARLLLHSALPVPDAGAEWVSEHSRGTAFVYPDHGRLWLGAQLLERTGQINCPEDARTLVERIYVEDAVNAMPPGLVASHQRAQALAAVDGAIGQLNTVPLRGCYEADGANWWSDVYTPTRLGEPSVTLALVEVRGQSLTPFLPGPFQWAMSSVPMRASLVGKPVVETDLVRTAAETTAGKWRVLMPMVRDGDKWAGMVERVNGKRIRAEYSRTVGFVLDG